MADLAAGDENHGEEVSWQDVLGVLHAGQHLGKLMTPAPGSGSWLLTPGSWLLAPGS